MDGGKNMALTSAPCASASNSAGAASTTLSSGKYYPDW